MRIGLTSINPYRAVLKDIFDLLNLEQCGSLVEYVSSSDWETNQNPLISLNNSAVDIMDTLFLMSIERMETVDFSYPIFVTKVLEHFQIVWLDN